MSDESLTTTTTYSEIDREAIASLLIGRRIVQAEKGSFDYPGRDSWAAKAEGRLVLDDGTVLYLTGHEGGCSCGAGDYPLASLAAVDNIITSARVECAPRGDDWSEDDWNEDAADGAYRIFVIADATEINVAEFVGSDGNGYYGDGVLVDRRPPACSSGRRRPDVSMFKMHEAFEISVPLPGTVRLHIRTDLTDMKLEFGPAEAFWLARKLLRASEMIDVDAVSGGSETGGAQ